MGSRVSQSPDGFCKGLSHSSLSPAGAAQQGQSEAPASGAKVRCRWQDSVQVVVLSILVVQWEQ